MLVPSLEIFLGIADAIPFLCSFLKIVAIVEKKVGISTLFNRAFMI